MARLPRLSLASIPQHVIQRGNNRHACFYADENYRFYLECLGEAARKYRVSVHAYVLMTNHVHLLMTPTSAAGMSQVMQTLGRRYVRYINYTYRRSGTLWEGRYHASLVQGDRYLLTCYRYIEFNPVRANITQGPADYRWSSYHCNALGQPDPLIEPHEDYLRLGTEPAERQAVYRDLFRVHIDPELLRAVRQATQTNRVFGADYFQQQIEAALALRIAKRKPGPRKRECGDE
ncbi:MAG: transposase [Gammaproteobacteria bacterium]